ncbi:MAG: hypothetical protein NTW38_10195 [Candidatus Aminicenantes bacterium]|nr:hypothetical protein [Candidatus Aminicenantes bacterium]
MRTIPTIRRTAVGVWLLLAAGLLSSGRKPWPPTRDAWDIKMTISVKGEYALEGRERASGRYQMTFVWTGGLETDGDDYILVHGRSDLAEWKAEESVTGPDGIRLLTTGDFGEKPELNVAYVLRKDGVLHLNFLIRGFDVPRSLPADAFYLHLPASAENSDRPGGLNYGVFVKKGSNAVVLDDPCSSPKTREKKFHWTWLHRTMVFRENKALFEMNRHEADVTVVVTPQNETTAGRIRPVGETCRKPGEDGPR